MAQRIIRVSRNDKKRVRFPGSLLMLYTSIFTGSKMHLFGLCLFDND